MSVYDTSRDRMAFYRDAYYGGDFWRNPSSVKLGSARLYTYVVDSATGAVLEAPVGTVKSYLVPHARETSAGFGARHSLAAYFNFVEPVVAAYADAVTAKVQRDLGSLGPLLLNLGGAGFGTDWQQHVNDVARWCCVYGYVATVFDVPEDDTPQSMGEQLDARLGVRALTIPPHSIAWVMVDHRGNITEFAYIDCALSGDMASDGQTYGADVWVYTTETWSVYKTALTVAIPIDEQRDTVLKGTPALTGKHRVPGQVPVRFAFFKPVTDTRLPYGLSLICDAADVARAVYNSMSDIDNIHRTTAFPFLAIPQRSVNGQLEPEREIQVGPGTALGFPAESGEPRWIQPDAIQPRELRDHCIFRIAMAYRLAGLEMSVEGTADTSSGLALQLKSRGFEARAAQFAKQMLAYELGSLTLVGKLVGQESVSPALNYPQRFVLADNSEALARAVLVLQTISEHLGIEGRLAVVQQALESAVNLPESKVQELMGEVRRNLMKSVEPAPTPAPAPAPTPPPKVGG